MKNLIVSFITIFLSLSINAQVTKTTSTAVDVFKDGTFSLTKFKVKDSLYYYALYYQNEEYKHIVSIEYVSFIKREDVIDFFTIVLEAFDTADQMTVTLNRKPIYIQRLITTVYIAPNVGFFTMTKKQVQDILNSMTNN